MNHISFHSCFDFDLFSPSNMARESLRYTSTMRGSRSVLPGCQVADSPLFCPFNAVHHISQAPGTIRWSRREISRGRDRFFRRVAKFWSPLCLPNFLFTGYLEDRQTNLNRRGWHIHSGIGSPDNPNKRINSDMFLGGASCNSNLALMFYLISYSVTKPVCLCQPQ